MKFSNWIESVSTLSELYLKMLDRGEKELAKKVMVKLEQLVSMELNLEE